MPKSSSPLLAGKYRLDARPDRTDFRDRPYLPPLRSIPPQYPSDKQIASYLQKYTKDGMILDQGNEGACTGFGLAAFINYIFWEQWVTAERPAKLKPKVVSPWMLYNNARLYDEWEGEDYEGSSCRGAMKGWHRHGVSALDLWPTLSKRPSSGWSQDAAGRPLGAYYRVDSKSILDMQAAVNEVHAVFCSARVHGGWDNPKTTVDHAGLHLKVIFPKKDIDGGHAFAVVGYTSRGFIIQNSWGSSWGTHGFALLPYEDWIENGDDAWVAALGAPIGVAEQKGASAGATGASLNIQAAGVRALNATSGRGAGATVNLWSEEQAYQHAIVMGNDGKLLRKVVSTTDPLDNVRLVANQLVAESGLKKLVLYAHGGLNDEETAIKRVRRMGPWFEANGIYPLFIVWRTGLAESIGHIGQDKVKEFELTLESLRSKGLGDTLQTALDKAQEAFDRAFEAVAEKVMGKAVWSQMKQNAAAAATGDSGGLRVLIKALLDLINKQNVEIHLLGHSAGAILLGHLITAANQKLEFGSCGLFAPACTSEFAGRHYGKALEAKIIRKGALHIDVLSDRAELEDSVGPYGKSLLYLVSRALEEAHKMPLLGMELAWNVKNSVKPEDNPQIASKHIEDARTWLALAKKFDVSLEIHKGPQVRVAPQVRTDIGHGTFDNDLSVMNDSIARILKTDRPNVLVNDLSGF